jgi:hypothetical protein
MHFYLSDFFSVVFSTVFAVACAAAFVSLRQHARTASSQ